MPHINLPPGLPGIRGLMVWRPETALPLNRLAEQLLRAGDSPLSPGERELIATYVSSLNKCHYCTSTHAAIARHMLDNNAALIDSVLQDPEMAPVSDKLKALLAIAAKVQQGGRFVEDTDIQRARNAGADDVEIHDTVLIAAAFCMFNRYVDGLATYAPDDPAIYDQIGRQRAGSGYLAPIIPAANSSNEPQ
jgi:uncharacterized peroxidase-related enzyme